jgi:protein gp37
VQQDQPRLQALLRGFELTLQPKMLELPLRWKKPQTIFVNSMSDLFHEDVPVEYIQRVFDVMRRAHWHRFQVLTKRADRLAELSSEIDWPENVWMGVSVENASYVGRIDELRTTGAHVKFLSLEPLLGPLRKLELTSIDWVIVGGESGPGARPCDVQWIRATVQQCREAGTRVWVKQLGSAWARDEVPDSKWLRGRIKVDRKGADPNEWPADLRVQEPAP